MNIQEFEEGYAARSNVSVEQLHAWGLFGAPCDCGDGGCRGFQMTHAWEDAIIENIERDVRVSRLTEEPK